MLFDIQIDAFDIHIDAFACIAVIAILDSNDRHLWQRDEWLVAPPDHEHIVHSCGERLTCTPVNHPAKLIDGTGICYTF